ncbi:MAG: helix-turn-helix domain-containing protein [Patescibacteria group bacterium]|nr:helix-turn-helix domain-containing protein [Patescibacteria group bacterium]
MLSVGTILSRQRKNKGLSIRQVEEKTRIREKFLRALEENDWKVFSSKVYITGLIKNYSEFLDLDTESMIAYFRRDYERQEEVKFKKKVESKYFKSETRRIVIAGVAVLLLVFAVYFGYQVKLFLTPPSLSITQPTEGTFRGIEAITVQGITEKDASVYIYGERVYQNQKGVFEYTMPLKKGSNTIVIEVIGANGKKNRVERTFILQ